MLYRENFHFCLFKEVVNILIDKNSKVDSFGIVIHVYLMFQLH